MEIPETRFYKCKMCGGFVGEERAKWKKKMQTDKNICPKCLEKRRLAEEKIIYNPYSQIMFRTQG